MSILEKNGIYYLYELIMLLYKINFYDTIQKNHLISYLYRHNGFPLLSFIL